jgi:4-amino-4-deoxy-L-arabinose transferase-like glycosyltransferase
MHQIESKSNAYYFILLFVLSFVFRLLLIIIFRFDGLYGQDAYAYLEFSKRFYEAISGFQIPPHFYWPIGFYLFASVFTILMGGNVDLSALLVSLNSGSLCAGFVYLLAYELAKGFDETERKELSIYAGLITIFSPILVKQSIVIMSDSLALMFASWALWQFVKYFNEDKLKNIIFAFILFSFAVMTRYAFTLLAMPVVLYLIYNLTIQELWRKKYIKDTLIAFIIGSIIFIPQFYYLFGHGISYFQYEGQHGTWAASWNFLNFFRKDFMTFDGTMHYRLWNGLYNLAPVFHPMYLSIFGIPFLTGTYLLFKRKKKNILVLLLAWIAVYYFYISGNPFQSLRYTMSFLPAMAIVSAYGLAKIKINNLYKYLFLYAGLFLFVVYGVYHISSFVEQKNAELEVVNKVSSVVPDGSVVFAFDITLAVNHYTKITAQEYFNYTEEELKNKITAAANDIYFILPLEAIKTQWKGLPLEKKYEFIKSNYPLQTVTSVNKFTILKIKKNK